MKLRLPLSVRKRVVEKAELMSGWMFVMETMPRRSGGESSDAEFRPEESDSCNTWLLVTIQAKISPRALILQPMILR